MPPTKKKSVGRGAVNLILPVAAVSGLNAVRDSVNAVGPSYDVSGTVPWAFISGNVSNRTEPIYNVTAPETIAPARSVVSSAILSIVMKSKGALAWNRNNIPLAGIPLRAHRMDQIVASTADWVNPSPGVLWKGEFGPLPGLDYDAEAEDEILVDRAFYDAQVFGSDGIARGGLANILSFDITRAFQASRRNGRVCQIIFPVPISPTGDIIEFHFDNANAYVSVVHTALDIEVEPPNGMYAAYPSIAGRPIDRSRLVDNESTNPSDRVEIEPTDEGETSEPVKQWVARNVDTGPAKNLGLTEASAEFSPVDNSTSVSGKLLYSIDEYDNAVGQGTPSGFWEVVAISSTTYSVYHTGPDGVRRLLHEQGTGATVVTFGADHIFVDADGNRIAKIRAVQWTGTTAANVADVWTAVSRADSRIGESPVTPTLLRITSPQDANQDAADSSRWAKLSMSRFEQLWGPTERVETSPGVWRAVVRLRDTRPGRYEAGQPIWIFNKPSTDVVKTFVEAVYAPDDATYPNSIRLAIDLAAGRFTRRAAVCTGVYFGTVAKANRNRLRLSAPLNAAEFFTEKVWTNSPDEMTVVSRDDAAPGFELVGVADVIGDHVTLAEPLPRAFAAGSLVFGSVPGNAKPVYFEAVIPENQTEGLYEGYARLAEFVMRDLRED